MCQINHSFPLSSFLRRYLNLLRMSSCRLNLVLLCPLDRFLGKFPCQGNHSEGTSEIGFFYLFSVKASRMDQAISIFVSVFTRNFRSLYYKCPSLAKAETASDLMKLSESQSQDYQTSQKINFQGPAVELDKLQHFRIHLYHATKLFRQLKIPFPLRNQQE